MALVDDLYPLGLRGMRMLMRMHDEHVEDVSPIRTYIHRYGNFLIVLISVGLAQVRPNQTTYSDQCIMN